jgi:hypothetical protein
VAADSDTTPLRQTAINDANPIRVPSASCSAIRSLGFLCNALPYPSVGHFIVLSSKGDIVFM